MLWTMRPVGRLDLSQARPQALVRRPSPTPPSPVEETDEYDTPTISSRTQVPLLPPSSSPAKAVLENSSPNSPAIVSAAPEGTDTASDLGRNTQSLALGAPTFPPPFAAVTEAIEAFGDDEDKLEDYQTQELEDSALSSRSFIVSVAPKDTHAASDSSKSCQPLSLDTPTSLPPYAAVAEAATEATADSVASSQVLGVNVSSHPSRPLKSEPESSTSSPDSVLPASAPVPTRRIHPPWNFRNPPPILDPSLGVPSSHVPRILTKTYQRIMAVLRAHDERVITISASDCWDPVYEILGIDPRHMYFNTEPCRPPRNTEEMRVFISTQVRFLATFEGPYISMYTSERDKGDQIGWIRREVVPIFFDQYPELELTEAWVHKLDRHCRARFTADLEKGDKDVNQGRTVRHKPRTVDWKASMAKAKSQEIGRRMAELREADRSEPQAPNLKYYHQAKSELINSATQEDRDRYAAEAEEANKKRNGPPTLEDIFSGQKEIIYCLQDSVNDHFGWEPGQSGDAVCYLVAAFRDQTNRINVEATFASNKKVKDTDPLACAVTKAYGSHVHKSFKRFAEVLLPRHKLNGKVPEVMLTEGGELTFPPLAVDKVAPRIVKELVRTFIVGSWDPEKSSGPGYPCTADDLPWTELENLEGREKYLESYEHFSALSTFNPDEMTHSELTSLVEAIGGTIGSLIFCAAAPPLRPFVPSPAKSSVSSAFDSIRSAPQSPHNMSTRDPLLENFSSVDNADALNVEDSSQLLNMISQETRAREDSLSMNNSLAPGISSVDDEAAVSQHLPFTVCSLNDGAASSPIQSFPGITPIGMALSPDNAAVVEKKKTGRTQHRGAKKKPLDSTLRGQENPKKKVKGKESDSTQMKRKVGDVIDTVGSPLKRRKEAGLRAISSNEAITVTRDSATQDSDPHAVLRRGARSRKAPVRADATPRYDNNQFCIDITVLVAILLESMAVPKLGFSVFETAVELSRNFLPLIVVEF
ncbi:hypothetical protein NP233_g334 [Leucocoprinus birnbaumii]|uniref:Uncharacterized protein n=1 Tax=Leucocoprinus birnbaumii TaxID=56174 RepID=A0AAD5W247_9AGAR|nr:hypothetical protein NP233_g334 [Leucocoprinus birnbaumii]